MCSRVDFIVRENELTPPPTYTPKVDEIYVGLNVRRQVCGVKKILVVEDEKNLSQIYKEKLEDVGYSVDIADTGFAAICYVKTTKPDLVILDINLPDVNGIKVLQEIKQEYDDLPVIMCTAYGQFEDYYQRFAGEETRFCGYLTKPVSLEILVSEVKRAIGDP